MSEIKLDVDQASELKAVITQVEHVIDCDANPFNPWAEDCWTVDEHQKGGQWKFDPKQVELFLGSGQKDGKFTEGNKLRKELAGKPVLNANVLDYLLANPHLIPEEWKVRYVFFWGTVYRRRDGNPYVRFLYRLRGGRLYVRYLYWSGGGWVWGAGWLNYNWFGYDPAALRAS